jgi:hypothetical protein
MSEQNVEICVNDRALQVAEFVAFHERNRGYAGMAMPRSASASEWQVSLDHTLNVTARVDGELRGYMRVLTDFQFIMIVQDVILDRGFEWVLKPMEKKFFNGSHATIYLLLSPSGEVDVSRYLRKGWSQVPYVFVKSCNKDSA